MSWAVEIGADMDAKLRELEALQRVVMRVRKALGG